MSTAPAIGTPRVPSIIPLVNRLVRRLLDVGLPFGPNVLLTVRGRMSGRPWTFPVAILEVGERRFVQSPFGEVNWVRNLRASGEAVITKGRRREEVVAIELAPEAASPILQAAFAPYMASRFGRFFVGRLFPLRAESMPEDYLAEARRHTMFELRAKLAEG